MNQYHMKNTNAKFWDHYSYYLNNNETSTSQNRVKTKKNDNKIITPKRSKSNELKQTKDKKKYSNKGINDKTSNNNKNKRS